jgi:hypothetical protein
VHEPSYVISPRKARSHILEELRTLFWPSREPALRSARFFVYVQGLPDEDPRLRKLARIGGPTGLTWLHLLAHDVPNRTPAGTLELLVAIVERERARH